MSWFNIGIESKDTWETRTTILNVVSGKVLSDFFYDRFIKDISLISGLRGSLGWASGNFARGTVLSEEAAEIKEKLANATILHCKDNLDEVASEAAKKVSEHASKIIPEDGKIRRGVQAASAVVEKTSTVAYSLWGTVKSISSSTVNAADVAADKLYLKSFSNYLTGTKAAAAVKTTLNETKEGIGNRVENACSSVKETQEKMNDQIKAGIKNWVLKYVDDDEPYADELTGKIFEVSTKVIYYSPFPFLGLTYALVLETILYQSGLKEKLLGNQKGSAEAKDVLNGLVDSVLWKEDQKILNVVQEALKPAFEKGIEIAAVKGGEKASSFLFDSLAKYALHECSTKLLFSQIEAYLLDYAAVAFLGASEDVKFYSSACYWTFTAIRVGELYHKFLKARSSSQNSIRQEVDKSALKKLVMKSAKSPIIEKLKNIRIKGIKFSIQEKKAEKIAEVIINDAIDIAWPMLNDIRVLGVPLVT